MRRRRHPPTLGPVDGKDDWLPTREAAAALGVTQSHVAWLLDRGLLTGERRSRGRLWVSRESLQMLVAKRADEAAEWVSWAAAVQLAGVPRSRIEVAVRSGLVTSRASTTARQSPSLLRASVVAFGAVEAERRQAAAEARKQRRSASLPPDDEHVWLDVTVTAIVLGISPNGVRYQARHGQLPHVMQGRRYWFRRDHVERAASARAFARAATGP